MYDVDYATHETEEYPDDHPGEVGVRNLVDQFEARGGMPVGPEHDHGAPDLDAVQPNQFPHRGLYSDVCKSSKKLPIYDTIFSLDRAAEIADLPNIYDSSESADEHEPFGSMFVLETIHRNDPRYYCAEAVAARQLEFDRMIEFKCFDMTKPIEGDHVPASATKITPIMLTGIKDVGLPSAKYNGRFVADGRRAANEAICAPNLIGHETSGRHQRPHRRWNKQ